jgi:hypothetical protein
MLRALRFHDNIEGGDLSAILRNVLKWWPAENEVNLKNPYIFRQISVNCNAHIPSRKQRSKSEAAFLERKIK